MKKKTIKSAIPIYGVAALWLLLGLICPRMLLKLWFLAIAAVLSVGVYFVLARIFPGRVIEVREAAASGDKAIDALIEEGRRQLDNLKAANDAIPDAEISRNLDRMVSAGEEIFRVLERETSQANAVRRFMNYYLPTTDKLMSNYRLMMETSNRGDNIESAMRSIENSLGMIASTFEKQLDNLYKDRSLDVETDIQVMETMLAGDGLTGQGSFSDMNQNKQTAQTGN
ncbi:MAG: 5-bromo-4-chloroindolyl phosphate hydrolysis family protein [Clostridia bacterium]|nr:5-bromo-4-chloroindolyl phosphate hydrolysis family protein [Clostridia bacterium]